MVLLTRHIIQTKKIIKNIQKKSVLLAPPTFEYTDSHKQQPGCSESQRPGWGLTTLVAGYAGGTAFWHSCLLAPGSWLSWLLIPGSWLLTPAHWPLTPDSWLLAPGSWLLAPGPCLLAPDFWLLASGSWLLASSSWVSGFWLLAF